MARKGLGRGLEAILGDAPQQTDATGLDQPARPPRDGVQLMPVGNIAPDPDQPRKSFDEASLEDLAASIKAQGILQPLLVRPNPAGQPPYLIIAGERRWRAATRAGLHDIPVLVRQADDASTAELALIENVQRTDLNPIEEADAYARMQALFDRKPADIAQAVGKSRSHVANMLRLTALPATVREHVANGALSMGHARALLTAKNPEQLAEKIIAEGLSVRVVEQLAQPKEKTRDPQNGASGTAAETKLPSGASKDADTKSLERDLEAALGLSVAIEHSRKGGTVTLTYDTLDQLDDICRRLMGAAF